MSRPTANFLPETWAEQTPHDPRPSLVVTTLLALLFLTIAMSAGPGEVAEAARPPAPQVLDQCRVLVDDEAAYGLWRAQRWRPWHRLLLQFPDYLVENSRIREISYNGDLDELTIGGEIGEATQLPSLMLRLEDYEWLTEPDPFSVRRNQETQRTEFMLRVKVLPLIPMEEERTP